MSEYHRERRRRLREAKLCVRCRMPSEKYACEACKVRLRQLDKQMRMKRRLLGRCWTCGKKDRRTWWGLRLCSTCMQYNASYRVRLESKRLAEGRCKSCGEVDVQPPYLNCASCRKHKATLEHQRRERLRRGE